MGRHRRRMALMLTGVLLLTGCWDRLEVNDVGLVTAIAVDQGQGNDVRVGLFLARGLGGSKVGPAHWLIEAEAPTMADAVRHISRTASRRVILDHVRVILIGERYASVGTGMADLLDFAGRHSEIRMTPRVLMTEGDAIALLGMEPHLEAEQPEALVKKLEAKGGLNPMLREVIAATIAEGRSPFIYTVHPRTGIIRSRGHDKSGTEIGGVALFASNRLVDKLGIPETRAFATLMGHPEDAELSVPCSGEPQKRFSVQLRMGKVKIKSALNGNQPSFHVRSQVRAVLVDSQCEHSNITIPANRHRFEEAVQTELRGEMDRLVKRMQQHQVDPVGFGKYLQLGSPGFFKQNAARWPEIWATSPVTTELRVILYHSNLLLDSVTTTRMELRGKE